MIERHDRAAIVSATKLFSSARTHARTRSFAAFAAFRP
jgi:hypothetical protein